MMKEKWYTMSAEAVLAHFGSDSALGLSGKTARARLRQEGENDIFAVPHSSTLKHVTYILSDISILLLVLTAVIAALFRRSGATAAILGVLIFSCALSVVVYVLARRTMERMAVCAMPRVRVIRGGKLYAIDVRDLVRGDVILLDTGDIVPADARLISADGLEVLEYTGKIGGKAERARTAKDPSAVYPSKGIRRLSEQKNMLFAGSLVLAGTARAVVAEVGDGCFIVSTEGRIPLQPIRERFSALSSFEKLCGQVSMLMLLLILPLILLGVWGAGKLGLMECFLLSLAFAVSSMSELAVTWGNFIVGRGLRAAASSGEDSAVIPHDDDIAAIAGADTVVLFDDAVLTEGNLTVKAAWKGLTRVPLDASGDPEHHEPWASALIAAGLPSRDALRQGGEEGRLTSALLHAAERFSLTSGQLRSTVRLLDFAPASPVNLFSTALIEENRSLYAICAGDLRTLLGRCTRVADASAPGGICLMRAERSRALLEAVDAELACGGFAVAYARRTSPCAHLRHLSMLQEELTLVGVLVYADPLGGGVRAAVDSLAGRGVRSLLMADSSAESRGIVNLARAAGILRNGVIARAPEPIPPDAELCLGYDMASCQAYLSDLNQAGKTAIGVGAKVSDLSLLRTCSVAAACTPIREMSDQTRRPIPITGADEYYGAELLNKNASLLIRRAGKQGGGIGGVLSAMRAAGRVFQNLRLATSYLLASQMLRMAILVLTLCLGMAVVTPLHLLFGGLIVDFAAALALAFVRGSGKGGADLFFAHPLRESMGWLCVGLACGVISTITAFVLHMSGILTMEMAGGFLFLSLLLAQAALLPLVFHTNGEKTISLPVVFFAACVLMLVLLCLFVPTVGTVFGVAALPLPAMLCLLIAPITAFFGGEIFYTLSLMHSLREIDDAET